ncbi:hypothetical protein OSB04_019651 [Centaurea solstitialis]|uniref:MULE transposase domain-containing protein n=1 Tax=Centaurea solstitialis TaxID=347529 RepID=A0AA38SR90_9ASTR|nr:hypothetical protein OSB04_019651 [Centaurea solstitialis]
MCFGSTCNVSTGQCHRARLRALYQIEGSLVEHYGRVWEYGAELLRSNPGSTVKIAVDEGLNEQNYFKGMYVCFKALKDGWKAGLDGCFLKSICRGELLSAIGRDANNQVYPIAWAVVSIENKENWKWFLSLLQSDIEMIDGIGLTLISDQHKGLIEAVKETLPYGEHRQCARHKYVLGAAMSTIELDFQRHMTDIKNWFEAAYNHLLERDPQSWCRAFFKLHRGCEVVENGLCESFNKMILDARKKPVITFMESVRMLVMQRIHNTRDFADELEHSVCPSIMKKIKFLSRNLRYYMLHI